jgi:Dihaem cytochrome c
VAFQRNNTLSHTFLMTVMMTLVSGQAAAGDLRLPSSTPANYRTTCGECHAAYPPALLPASSWQRVMRGLDKHYGVDASVEPALVQQISVWLTQESARGGKVQVPPPDDRLTRSPWFVRHHDEVPRAVWALPSVKSPSNCAACHTSADRGVFSEHDLKAPAGMTAAQRRLWQDD